MNKQILLAFVFVLALTLSLGTIYASDANVTDSHATGLVDNTSIDDSTELSVCESGMESNSSGDVLQSENSNTLSTNTENSDVLGDTNPSVDVTKTITSNDVTKYYKGSTKYTATFLDKQGSPLANSDVVITVKGQSHTVKTDGNGVASLSINLKPGTYDVVATNPATGFNLTTTFKILSTISAKDTTKVYKDGKQFHAKFLNSNGKPLSNKKIKFKINGKTYTKKTNKKGVASLSLTSLKKGTYKIISYNKDGLTNTNKIKVVKSTSTSLTADDYTFLKKDKKKIKVRLLNRYGYAPNKGMAIKFKVNGKTYSSKTNGNGYATLKLPSLKSGVYTVKYSFAKTGPYKASSTKSRVSVIPSKDPNFTVKSTTTFGHGAGTSFKVALKSGNVPLSGETVTLNVNGESYTKTTNSKGIVSLPINLEIGNYNIDYSNKHSSKINSKSGSTPISVIERSATSVKWQSATSFYQGTQSCQLLVLDANNKVVSNGVVKVTVNSQTYTVKTSSNGYATLNANFPVGNYAVSYSFAGNNLNAPSSGSINLNVLKITKISLNNVVKGASDLKSYYGGHGTLPNSVSAGGVVFTIPEFLYVMSQAISQISAKNYNDIQYIEGISAPSSPTGDSINANLYTNNYVTVAKNAAEFIRNNRVAPNYANSAVGKIVYEKLVDAESRILAFYKTNKRLPNYVSISTTTSSATQSGTGLNDKNTIADLSPYLKATKNCQVDNVDIKKIVNSVTKGLTSNSAKAKAIFNYVRDTLSYSFYYNTKHGALGTLKAKSGNCVDHSHLLVAMFRTADIPARYVHGNCKFTSGSTYGHVWVQVLIDGKWTVADATSSRNSLGNVANWNTKSFTLKGIYSSLSF